MQEGFSAKNKIISRGNSIDYGGDGRYLYIQTSNSGIKLECYDTSLLTATNYLGSGNWTVSPLVTSINVGGTLQYSPVIYIPSRKEIWCITRSNSTVRVNANPNSGTFNTVLGSFAHGTSSDCVSAVYDSGSDCVWILGANVQRRVDCKTLTSVDSSSYFTSLNGSLFILGYSTVGQASYCAYNHNRRHLLLGNGSSVTCVFDPLNKSQLNPELMIPGGFSWSLMGDFVIARSTTNSLISIYRYLDNRYVYQANISVGTQAQGSTNTAMRYGYCARLRKIFLQSGNFVQVVSLSDTPNLITAMSKGTIVGSETQTGMIIQCYNEGVLIAMADGGTSNAFHVFDPVNNSYIGYCNLVGSNTIGGNTSYQFWACKNQLEI